MPEVVSTNYFVGRTRFMARFNFQSKAARMPSGPVRLGAYVRGLDCGKSECSQTTFDLASLLGDIDGFCRISGAWLRKATSLTTFSNSEAVELVGCGHG